MIKVMVTGHRPNKIGGYDPTNFTRRFVKDELKYALTRLKERHGNILGISGMALGVDQDFADCCVDLGIPFEAYVPFRGQEGIWPPDSKKEYDKLLDKSSEVKIISEGAYSPKKMHIRNKAMVDDSDITIAVWNGDQQGGTFGCVKMAKESDNKMHFIDPRRSHSPTRVFHWKKEKCDVYVGRPTIFGNLWSHEIVKDTIKVDSREDAVKNYKNWLTGKDFIEFEQNLRKRVLDSLCHLKGKKIGCWCHPLKCHADILADITEKIYKSEYHVYQKLLV